MDFHHLISKHNEDWAGIIRKPKDGDVEEDWKSEEEKFQER